MGSKKKTFSDDMNTVGNLQHILTGMAQLLEWMEQLLSAAIKQVGDEQGDEGAVGSVGRPGRGRAVSRKRGANIGRGRENG